MSKILLPVLACFMLLGCAPEDTAHTDPATAQAPEEPAAPANHQETELDRIQAAGRTQEQTEIAQRQQSQSNGRCPHIGPYNEGDSNDPKGGWDTGCNTKEFQAREIFELDNCRVYRFHDGNGWVYYQDCNKYVGQ